MGLLWLLMGTEGQLMQTLDKSPHDTPSLTEGTITHYCGSLATCKGCCANMLDHVVHFPKDFYDTKPSCLVATGRPSTTGKCSTPCAEDTETCVRNFAVEFMDAGIGNIFLLKHLLVDLHNVRGKQQTLLAQIKHGLVEPSQAELHISPNDVCSNMSLKRRNDFLEHQR